MSKTLFVLLASALAACAADSTSSTARAIIETPCAADADCPTGFECEVEVEHGTTTSFCQAHDEDGTCPAGYELEVEHGQEFCQPHGGGDDDGTDAGTDDSGTDDNGGTGTGPSGSTCTTDADCAAGLECEVEVEHGTTTSTCQPHGGV
jgi:hypothetical protein